MPEARGATSIDRFVLLYALAWAGGTIAYTPLLTILLPARVADLAGAQAGVGWLGSIAIAGAVAASLGGIAFGYLSDITRNRRGWIGLGLALLCLLLPLIGEATSLRGLILAIILWQLALNMMLGPLAAWAADLVPDGRKGLLGGLMAFAPGLGALAAALVTHPGLAADGARLWLVSALVALCVVPVLLVRPPAATGPAPATDPPAGPDGHPRAFGRATVIRMWLARLSVQIAEAAMFAYLFFWLVSLDAGISDNQSARLFSLVMLASAPLALMVGRWSDLRRQPVAPLLICALLSAAGLAAMAFATSLPAAALAYGLFGIAGAMFLALHSAQTLRILPRPDRRGRDLGLFNLANTI
ncbi:MAG: MFS transporter, partial [Sandaracinobacteroides sp.]